MGPLTPVDSPVSGSEVLILVEIMGIIHYLFIPGQECENAYPMNIWTVKDMLT